MSFLFYTCGGLGNLLFQHNAAYAFAKDKGLELEAYSDMSSNCTERPPFSHYDKLFSHVKHTDERRRDDYNEPDGLYRPIPPESRTVKGYFQCYDYFKKYQLEIRDLLRQNEKDLFSSKQTKHNTLSDGKTTVCVHIRRGDYVLYQANFPLTPESYYEKSMARFKDYKFLVFCDDMHLIKDWEVWKKYDVSLIEDEPNALDTFFLMSCCDHFIIANSSLSLMAYYMRSNENARILCPDTWFGPRHTIPYNLEQMVDSRERISMVITTYDRFDTFLDATLEKYISNPYLYEIVICDDCSPDYKKLIDKYGGCDKVKLYRNDERLGCFYNKLKACKHATGDWICLMDSDNVCDLNYFDALFKYWSTNTYSKDVVYCPEKALPNFIYSSLIETPIDKTNWNDHYKGNPGGCFLNTCNNIFHKSILYMQDNPEINPHGYDSLFIAYRFIKNGIKYVCVPGMTYEHRVHGGSNWVSEVGKSEKVMESFDFKL